MSAAHRPNNSEPNRGTMASPGVRARSCCASRKYLCVYLFSSFPFTRFNLSVRNPSHAPPRARIENSREIYRPIFRAPFSTIFKRENLQYLLPRLVSSVTADSRSEARERSRGESEIRAVYEIGGIVFPQTAARLGFHLGKFYYFH